MNLFELKIVLQQLRRDLKCPYCTAEYSERKIQILGTNQVYGMFLAECQECTHRIIITVSVARKHRRISSRPYNYWKVGESVSTDEVLDMHNFLNNFDGDLTSLIPADEK